MKDENQPCKIVDRKNEKDFVILNYKTNEYRSSFTIHGLSRALTGHCVEKVFWGLLVLISLSIIIYIVASLAKKFNRHDVYIQLYTKEYTESDTPFLTICPINVKQLQFCSFTNNCLGHFPTSNMSFNRNDSYSWGNDKIYINIRQRSVKKEYQLRDFISVVYFGCIRLNLSIFDTSSFSSNGISVYTAYPEQSIEVFVHNADEPYPFLQSNAIEISRKQSTEINIELKKYERLEAPFASNCTKSAEPTIFPGKYSKLKCVESLKCVNGFKTCGLYYDICQELLPTQFKSKYAKQITTEEQRRNVIDCLEAEFAKHYDKECGLPCKEQIYTVITSLTRECSWLADNQREIFINYPLNPYYHIFKEAQLYPFEQLLSECGGLFGLFIGSSAISFIEILVFLSLLFFRKIFIK